jgi:hypothetical protein
MQINRLAHSQTSPPLKAQRQGILSVNPEEDVQAIEQLLDRALKIYQSSSQPSTFQSSTADLAKQVLMGELSRLKKLILSIPDSQTLIITSAFSHKNAYPTTVLNFQKGPTLENIVIDPRDLARSLQRSISKNKHGSGKL